MRQAMRLLLVGTAIVGARGRVTPGLCFELRLSTGGRYAINLGHQLEGIGPLLAAGVRQQPAAIVATQAPPMSYWEGAFRAVFPGTKLVKGRAPAGLRASSATRATAGRRKSARSASRSSARHAVSPPQRPSPLVLAP